MYGFFRHSDKVSNSNDVLYSAIKSNSTALIVLLQKRFCVNERKGGWVNCKYLTSFVCVLLITRRKSSKLLFTSPFYLFDFSLADSASLLPQKRTPKTVLLLA